MMTTASTESSGATTGDPRREIAAATVKKLTAEYLADLIVDNGEGGAQIRIEDACLRRSLVLNAKVQIQRLRDAYDILLSGGTTP